MHKLESILGEAGSRLWDATLESVVEAARLTDMPIETTERLMLHGDDSKELITIPEATDNDAIIVIRVPLQKYEVTPANAVDAVKLMVDLINSVHPFRAHIEDFLQQVLRRDSSESLAIHLVSVDIVTGKQDLIGGIGPMSNINFTIYASLTFHAEK